MGKKAVSEEAVRKTVLLLYLESVERLFVM
jgi:hypothetical protein